MSWQIAREFHSNHLFLNNVSQQSSLKSIRRKAIATGTPVIQRRPAHRAVSESGDIEHAGKSPSPETPQATARNAVNTARLKSENFVMSVGKDEVCISTNRAIFRASAYLECQRVLTFEVKPATRFILSEC